MAFIFKVEVSGSQYIKYDNNFFIKLSWKANLHVKLCLLNIHLK